MKKQAKIDESKDYALLLNHNLKGYLYGRSFPKPFLQYVEIKNIKSREGKLLKSFETHVIDEKSFKIFNSINKNDLKVFTSEEWADRIYHLLIKGEKLNKTNCFDYALETFAKETKLLVDRLTEISDIKWYHKLVLENEKTRTEKIEFIRTYKSLDFKLVNSENGFNVVYNFTTDQGEIIESSELDLFFGFLRRNTNYYILKVRDMAVLHLLRSLNIEQHKDNLPAFIKYVLGPIEKTNKIQREDLIDVDIEEIVPKKQLQLTELAGNFLVITPKFDYGLASFESEYQEFQEFIFDGKYHKIKRHKEIETSFRSYLKGLHPRFQNQFMGSHNLSFDEAKKGNWFFKVYHEWLDQDIEIIGMDLMKNFKYSPHQIETKLTPKSTFGNLITFKCTVSFGKEKVKLSDLKKVILIGGRSIYLKDNSLGVITEEWIEEYGLIFKHGKISKDEIVVPQWIGVSQENTAPKKSTNFVISKDWWERWTTWQNSDKAVVNLPASIKAELRDYQRKGFEWLVLLNEINAGACLADDMGLGKTLQTITYMAHLAEKNEASKMLVICPASLLYNWKNEIEKFATDFITHIYHGINRDFKKFIESDSNVLICSYSTARIDYEILRSIVWDIMVLDESHNIRSFKAQTTQAILKIHALSNVILSGTPMINNTFDLYAQFEVILPGLLGGQEFFNSYYATQIDKMRNPIAIQNLNKLIKPFLLRRTKQQVADDLPEKIESVMFCEMNADQKEIYEAVKEEVGNSVFLGIQDNGIEKSRLHILQAIGKLRQICCHPKIVANGEFEAVSSVKLTLLIEEIERNLSDHKVLVFSQYLGMLDEISLELTTRNIPHFRFDGSTSADKRMEMVDSFQKTESKERIFLASLKAGNTGITLTEADYVFLVDPWWNEAIQRQAIDRTHRIGQKKTVFAYKMICKDSIEERMLILQKRKQLISDELIVEDENIVKNLTLSDLQFLFG